MVENEYYGPRVYICGETPARSFLIQGSNPFMDLARKVNALAKINKACEIDLRLVRSNYFGPTSRQFTVDGLLCKKNNDMKSE